MRVRALAKEFAGARGEFGAGYLFSLHVSVVDGVICSNTVAWPGGGAESQGAAPEDQTSFCRDGYLWVRKSAVWWCPGLKQDSTAFGKRGLQSRETCMAAPGMVHVVGARGGYAKPPSRTSAESWSMSSQVNRPFPPGVSSVAH